MVTQDAFSRSGESVVVVTDSTCNIPEDVRAGLPIEVVPVIINLGDRSYRDEVDLPARTFYQYLAQDPRLAVTTSCPAPGDFVQTYRAVAEYASGIVSVHLASNLSGIYESACEGARLLEPEGPAIEMVDSGTVSMALGFCVLAAARVAAAGGSLAAAAQAARDVSHRVKMLAIIKTLERVVNSGRVPALMRYLVAQVPIYPVVSVGNWRRPYPIRIERTYKRALTRLVDIASRDITSLGDGPKGIELAVMHADAADEAAEVAAQLAARHACRHVIISEFTPVMGAHTGAGLVGVAYYLPHEASPECS